MSQKDYDMSPRWYVVHTYSGYENKVKTDLEKTVKNRELEDYFFDIVVPMEEQIEIKDGQRKANLKKVFPGYVLVKMIVTEETWYIVRNTRGVTGFVGSGTDPIPLTDEEIRAMGFEDASISVDYDVNDSVQILNGPFKDSIGTVQEINKEIKIKLPNILFLIFIFLISKLNENLWNNLKTYTKYIVFVFLYLPSQPKDNYGKRRKTYCISMAFDCITNACTHCESSPFPQCNRRYFLPFKYSTQP